MIKLADGLYIAGEEHDQMSWTLKEGSLDIILHKSGHGKVLRDIGIGRTETVGGGWIIKDKICFTSGSIHSVPQNLQDYVITTISQWRQVRIAA